MQQADCACHLRWRHGQATQTYSHPVHLNKSSVMSSAAVTPTPSLILSCQFLIFFIIKTGENAGLTHSFHKPQLSGSQSDTAIKRLNAGEHKWLGPGQRAVGVGHGEIDYATADLPDTFKPIDRVWWVHAGVAHTVARN
ncbi:MAG: hypothetical protein R8G34_10880 [Paracoccaceae bacterium]|nr:hypothetical protein [Paracoccaceae bacterium]